MLAGLSEWELLHKFCASLLQLYLSSLIEESASPLFLQGAVGSWMCFTRVCSYCSSSSGFVSFLLCFPCRVRDRIGRNPGKKETAAKPEERAFLQPSDGLPRGPLQRSPSVSSRYFSRSGM